MGIIDELKSITGLKDNDFYPIRYMVNNQQRAHQVQASIMEDMRVSGVSAIIPPDISSYIIGFLNVANTVLGKSWSKAGSTFYSEEREQFLMYEIATEVLASRGGADPFKRVENRRHNLVGDTREFIKQVITNMAWDKMDAVQAGFKGDDPETLFIDFMKLYLKKAAGYTGGKFFDIFFAYKELYEYLKAGNVVKYDGIIIIEDFELMEPIFKEIASMLKAAGVTVVLYDKFASITGKGASRMLYNCMIPLDEAEITGFKIKELLANGVTPSDISVINYNNKTAELLKLVFDRFGIAYYSEETIGASPVFELLKSAVMLCFGSEENKETYLMFLGNPNSSCRMSNFGFSVFKTELNSLGYIAEKDPANAIERALEASFIRREAMLAKETDAEIIKKRKAILKADSDAAKRAMTIKTGQINIKVILDEVIDADRVKNTELLASVIHAARIMDELMEKASKASPADKLFLLEAMFEITGSAEYVEYADPVKEAMLIGSSAPHENAGAYVAMLDGTGADTLSSTYLFMTGLDAGMDKRPVVSYPAALGTALGFMTPETKKEAKYASFVRGFENARNLNLSYSYIKPGGTVLGIASALKVIKDGDYGIKEVMNADKSLLRGFDIIGPSALAPDEAYRYFMQGTSQKSFGSKEKKAASGKAQALGDALKDKKGGIDISVTSLSRFVMCPRMFAFEKLAERAGIKTEDMEGSARMKKGSLWHLTYRYAAEDRKNFNSANEKKTLEALITGYERAVKEIDPEITDERSAIEMKKEAELFTLPLFASNEVARRKLLKMQETILFEEDMSLNCGGFNLRGKADRIDKTDTGFIVWDYKTGNTRMEDFHLLNYGNSYVNKPREEHKFNSKAGDYAIQIAAYMYMLTKAGGDELKIFKGLGSFGGGIIYVNGMDTSATMEAIAAQSPYAAMLVEAACGILNKFLKVDIGSLEQPGMDSTGLTSADKCGYCSYVKNCGILAMGGVSNA
jgi:hypothetical protein